MTEQDCYFKSTEGLERLKDFMEYLSCFREGIDRIALYDDKRAKFLPEADRVKIAGYMLNLDEIYWKQFHIFIDRVYAYKKFMA